MTQVAHPPAGPRAAAPANVDGPTKVRFLMEMADRFERDGNLSEAVKSAETALLLRRSLPSDAQALFANSLPQQAADLVVKCNALGVAQFQRDNYQLSEFLMGKALFLTEDTASTNCFGTMEHDRLRLRAATFNNLGCMEKRRGGYDIGLAHLHKAAEIESLVDPDAGPSPSTQLNLCTLLNKMSRHAQAAAAAERAVRQLEFARSQGLPTTPAMVLMAYYNYGVSLEFAGRPGDMPKAREAYSKCVTAGVKFGLNSTSNSALAAAEKALSRLEAAVPIAEPMAGSGMQVARARDSMSVASSEGMTPRAPGTLRQAPPTSRGIMTAPAGSSRDDLAKHRDRIQLRQRRRDENENRAKDALRRAQLAHNREKNEKLREAQEKAAREREELAKRMYETMEAAIRRDRIRTLLEAATTVQKTWRGFLVRSHLRDMAIAVVKMQAVVRSYLCRRYLQRKEDEEKEAARNRAVMQTRLQAAVVLQRRVRQFLRRCNIVRQYRARQLRRRCCVKKIWRFFTDYRRRVADRILDKLDAERKAIATRNAMLNEAARKIQSLYRSFKSRRFMRVVRQEQMRRNAAATKIQAAMRGCLTRAWFKHYRLYRREQELSTAANLRAITKIQCAWRVGLARRERRRRTLEKRHRERQRVLFVAARRIQCAWRCFVARQVALAKNRVRQRKNAAATAIQRRWQVYLCRREYLWRRDEARKLRALCRIQTWWREMIIRKRHIETAKYHAKMMRRERELTARTYLAVSLSAALRYVASCREMIKRKARYEERSEAAGVVQRIGRGAHARTDLAAYKRISLLVAKNAETKRIANKAACTIQRSTRMFLAKEKCNRKRREKWACIRIQSIWRMAIARRVMLRRKAVRTSIIRDAAARKIQKSIRLHLKRKELKRLDEFYTARRRHKLMEQRRVEAATTIQAHWRGFATRRATADARARLLMQVVQAIRIQRAFRRHLYRRGINEEFQRRQRHRVRRTAAAISIQSFWRRVLATEYVAVVRERKFNHTVAAICIQCAWRRFMARHEVRRRREIRDRLQRLAAAKHDAWSLGSLLLQTVLRYRRDAALVTARHERQLQAQVDHKQRMTFLRRARAATKIAAVYRGHYERVYARGLRAEARLREQQQRALNAKKLRAALRIQCALRSHWARVEAAKRKTAKRLRQLDEELHEEEVADPRMVIKNMFWAHEATIKRDLTKERLERNERRDAAATKIQKIARGFLAKCRCKRIVREREAAKLAAKQQEEQAKLAAEASKAREIRRTRAAIKIQSVARLFFVRLRWPEMRRRLSQSKGASVRDEERRDTASAQIQAVYRGHRARLYTSQLLEERASAKMQKIRFEAARLIQKHVRKLIAVNRVTRLRFAKMQQNRSEGERTEASSTQPAVVEVKQSGAAPPVPPPRKTMAPTPPMVPRPPSGGTRRPSRPSSGQSGAPPM